MVLKIVLFFCFVAFLPLFMALEFRIADYVFFVFFAFHIGDIFSWYMFYYKSSSAG